MAAIDAAPRGIRKGLDSGLRPFDIGRDLRPVAELIADAFTNELDPRGMAALREMRIMSHLSGLLKVISRSTGELADVFSGYVWVEDGKVVGNVTVQRADKYGSRWQIANVAVAPEWRGRGIARRLMDQALDHVAAADGGWAVLQVFDHNRVARTLYSGLGFEEVGGMVDLVLNRLPRVHMPPDRSDFRPFSGKNWQPLYELATHQLNGQAQWWRALRRSDFELSLEQQFGEWVWQRIGKQRILRRAVRNMRRFEAAVVLTAARWRGDHRLELWARPDQYGELEDYLVRWALAALQDYPRAPVRTTVAADHTPALSVLQELGFQARQTLITMRRRVSCDS